MKHYEEFKLLTICNRALSCEQCKAHIGEDYCHNTAIAKRTIENDLDFLEILVDEKITINYNEKGEIIISSYYPLSKERREYLINYFKKLGEIK